MRLAGLLVAAGFLAVASVPTGAEASSPSISKLLRDQGFSRPLGPSTSIRRLGTMTDAHRSYEVFRYFHTFRAGMVRHGRQSLIFVENGTRYVGAYEAGTTDCSVLQNTLLCLDPDLRTETVRLVRGRPPKHTVIDGELVDFYK